jgi:hypothetical protein
LGRSRDGQRADLYQHLRRSSVLLRHQEVNRNLDRQFRQPRRWSKA